MNNKIQWTLDLIEKIRLAKIGEETRLDAIKNALENGKTVYDSDKKYLMRKFEELKNTVSKKSTQISKNYTSESQESSITNTTSISISSNHTRTKHIPSKNFEGNFWKTFSGEKRLLPILIHFATEFSQTMDQNKEIFAERIIGDEIIGKELNVNKLLEFVENELSKVEVKQTKTKRESNTTKQEEITIYDVDKLTGIQFEKFMEKLLNANGYSDAKVVGKVGDQGGDIEAYNDDEKFIIQAKNYALNRKVTNSAVQEVFAAIAYYGADQGIVVTNSSFTPGAKELAKVNNITLWDRRIVSQMLEGYNQVQN